MTNRYPLEQLDPDDDDGTMPSSREELEKAVVGHKIVSAEKRGYWVTVLTLDNGQEVELIEGSDCCAYTEIESFLLHPESVDHVITGVGTTDGYHQWHIYADLGDMLELTVNWSCGNPFYYGYGFTINVKDVEP
jgi:hypothetical protein